MHLTEKEWYKGVEGEIVGVDCYKLKELSFVPEVIFDLGANVGIFTNYAHKLFPEATIISVEPSRENVMWFKKLVDFDKNILVEAAIGNGRVFKNKNFLNGSHEGYFSNSNAYPQDEMAESEVLVEVESNCVLPASIINEFLPEGKKSMCKIDIEGNEYSFFQDQPSMDALKRIDYIAMEVHFFALSINLVDEARKITLAALAQFNETHHCVLDDVYFFAIKK